MSSWRPPRISERPLEFLVAFFIFFAGAYGFLDPNWPPEGDLGSGYWIIIAEDLYMVIAGVVIITALIIQGLALKGCTYEIYRPNAWWLAHAIAWEMFGWLFVSSATAVVAATAFILPPTALLHGEQPFEILLFWMFMWGAVSAASFIKFWNIRRSIRSRK
jgi:hypothetical protein